MSNNSLYEITQLLYEVLERVTRIEKALYDDVEEPAELDGGVPFTIVSNDEAEKVIEFPRQD
jgi:hypothetical protein